MKDFKGKVAVVTGAASGIGKGIALRCAEEGMKVVLADVEDKTLAEAGKVISKLGGPTLAIRTDVSRAEDIEKLAKKTQDAFGGVHLLFNNAGVQTRMTTWESTLADWEWVINVNLWGVIHGIRTFVRIMLQETTDCHIVNTSSAAALISAEVNATYSTTKAGVVTLSETLYLELKRRGPHIGVSVLCPALVRTRLNEAERNRPADLSNPPRETVQTPEELAREKMFQQMNENGMPPEQCADVVFQAIRENKFYIFTHPEWNTAIRRRMEAILEGSDPSPPQIPDDDSGEGTDRDEQLTYK